MCQLWWWSHIWCPLSKHVPRLFLFPLFPIFVGIKLICNGSLVHVKDVIFAIVCKTYLQHCNHVLHIILGLSEVFLHCLSGRMWVSWICFINCKMIHSCTGTILSFCSQTMLVTSFFPNSLEHWLPCSHYLSIKFVSQEQWDPTDHDGLS